MILIISLESIPRTNKGRSLIHYKILCVGPISDHDTC